MEPCVGIPVLWVPILELFPRCLEHLRLCDCSGQHHRHPRDGVWGKFPASFSLGNSWLGGERGNLPEAAVPRATADWGQHLTVIKEGEVGTPGTRAAPQKGNLGRWRSPKPQFWGQLCSVNLPASWLLIYEYIIWMSALGQLQDPKAELCPQTPHSLGTQKKTASSPFWLN